MTLRQTIESINNDFQNCNWRAYQHFFSLEGQEKLNQYQRLFEWIAETYTPLRNMQQHIETIIYHQNRFLEIGRNDDATDREKDLYLENAKDNIAEVVVNLINEIITFDASIFNVQIEYNPAIQNFQLA